MTEEVIDRRAEALRRNLNFDNSPFKDSRGRFITEGLFVDLKKPNNEPMYTLREQDYNTDGKMYPSLKRLYLEEEDLTELEFARKYLFSYRHWKVMCNNKVLARHIEDWREELEVQLRSKALKGLINTAIYEGSKGTTAAKFIVERGWLDKSKRKEDTTKEQVQSTLEDDIGYFLQRVK